MPPRPRLLLVTAVVALASLSTPHALAQASNERGELSEAWVGHLLDDQDDADTFLRYLAAPSAVVLSGLAFTAPLWGELNTATNIAWVTAGAGFMAAAVGTWATPDPDAAQRWYGRTASLGFTAFGVGLAAYCVDRTTGCGRTPVTRHLGTALGVAEAGVFLSAFFVWTLAPPPSLGALSLSVRGLPEAERRTRVSSFLKQRDQQRLLTTYLGAPWGLAMGTSFLVFAHEAEASSGRTYAYVMGSLLLAVVTGTTLYDLLRTPDSERFDAGEWPDE